MCARILVSSDRKAEKIDLCVHWCKKKEIYLKKTKTTRKLVMEEELTWVLEGVTIV